jgi:hypothetical protein
MSGPVTASFGSGAEPGLFVIWSRARAAEQRIITAIDDMFAIHDVMRIRWSPDRVDENFARFYSAQLIPPYSTVFSDVKGREPFTLIIVSDSSPRYEMRETTRGRQLVNSNLLDAKQRFRAWVGGAMTVHGSQTAAEGVRDLRFLLGEVPEPAAQGPWDGTIPEIARDLPGARGWASMAEILTTLNDAVDYVVLRNFEQLPDDLEVGPHTDVDLLVDDYHEAIRVLNARPMSGLVPRWGGRFTVRLAGNDVVFDLRFVGDGYYDERWQRRLLERRRLRDGGFYAPAVDDYLDSLAYHAVVHKRTVDRDYPARLATLACTVNRPEWSTEVLASPQDMGRVVRRMVDERGYRFVRPRDVTVFYNFHNVGARHPWLRRKLAGLHRATVVNVVRLVSPLVRFWRTMRRDLIARHPSLRSLSRIQSFIGLKPVRPRQRSRPSV